MRVSVQIAGSAAREGDRPHPAPSIAMFDVERIGSASGPTNGEYAMFLAVMQPLWFAVPIDEAEVTSRCPDCAGRCTRPARKVR